VAPAEGAGRRPGGPPRLAPVLGRIGRCAVCPSIPGYRKFPRAALGKRDARFVLVGEAPGRTSLERGRQWSGPGGLLLRHEAGRLGIDLEDLFYLTNAVKCWPAATTPAARGANRSPYVREQSACRPHLLDELGALDPEVIVAVGAVAARAVTGLPIRLPRDHGLRVRVEDREVIVLLHPANASRHPAVWPTYRADVLAVFAELAARAGFPLVEVSAAVIRRRGRYLVTQRAGGRHLAGMWEFPGGKRQPGESPTTCLLREIEEELGVTPEIGPRIAVVPWSYPDRRVVLHFFRCRLPDRQVEPREGQAMRWVTPKELRRLPVPPADLELVRWLSGRPPR
jgi:8-oxo-dGTP diphosphatase